MFDFTLQKYKEICLSIVNSPFEPITVLKYLSTTELPKKFIILRHDVDRKPERAETMARLEYEMGIKSTYYFRKNNNVFKPEIIKRISGMGHEIGYHYEVLDKAKGNIKKACSIFNEELKIFRDIVDIKTVAMHGNPLTRWINSNFWKSYNLDKFGLRGEATISITDTNLIYYTDTGRSWNTMESNLKDFISANFKALAQEVKNTDELIKLILHSNDDHQLYLSVHPNRWNDDYKYWIAQFAKDYLENMVKLIIRLARRNKFTIKKF